MCVVATGSTIYTRWSGWHAVHGDQEISERGMNGLNEVLEESFAQYVRGARPALRRNAFVLVGDWFTADDLVQQTLIVLYRRWERLEQHDALSGYARTVMVRLFISERRAHRWTRELLHDSPPDSQPAPEEAARVGDRIMLLGVLATLTPKQRSLVYLRYWEDLSIEETAQIMDCSPATVRSSASRTLRILRQRLGSLGSAPDSTLLGAAAGEAPGLPSAEIGQ
ncbi:SigE family RNA polymerase sigma factor [Streptomyces griseoincarnatus]